MIYLTHVPWNKYDPNYNKKHYPHGYLLANYYALPRIKFKGNEYKCNVRLNESFSPVFHYTYRKSGENTAIIHCSGHDGGCQYFLTFETPRSGTAVFEAVNAADKEELRGIRFSIK